MSSAITLFEWGKFAFQLPKIDRMWTFDALAFLFALLCDICDIFFQHVSSVWKVVVWRSLGVFSRSSKPERGSVGRVLCLPGKFPCYLLHSHSCQKCLYKVSLLANHTRWLVHLWLAVVELRIDSCREEWLYNIKHEFRPGFLPMWLFIYM